MPSTFHSRQQAAVDKCTMWLSLVILIIAVPHSNAAVLPPLSRHIGSTATDTCGVAICVAMDESGSIGSSNFAKSKQFVIDVINGVSQVASVAQYGASRFQTNAQPVQGLASMTTDAAAAKDAINRIVYPGSGGTNMEGGISECFRVEDSVATGVLTQNIIPNLPRVLFLLTDGKPNYKNIASAPNCSCNPNRNFPEVCLPRDWVSSADISQCSMETTRRRAAAATAAGIKFISVGVGSSVNATFLQEMGDYYPVANFNDLQAAVAGILRALCSDAQISKSASDSPQPVGGAFGFRLDIVNTGKFDIRPHVNFTDTLPAGLTYDAGQGVVALPSSPPASCAFTASTRQVSCTINEALPVGQTWSYGLFASATSSGNWTNIAEVSAFPDNNPNNNRDSVEVEVLKDPPPITEQDLNITKIVNPSLVVLGTPFTYTITITNRAALTTASEAFAVDTLPPGLEIVTNALPPGCTRPGSDPLVCGPVSLEPGRSAVFQILAFAEYGGQFDNIAIMEVDTGNKTVESSPVTAPVTVLTTCSKFKLNSTTLVPFGCEEGYRFNATEVDNQRPSQETCCIPLVPEVSLTKSVAPASTIVTGVVTYIITIRNTGDGQAKDLVLTDKPTEGLVFLQPLPEETARDCSFPDSVSCGDVMVRNQSCPTAVLDTLVCGRMLLSPDETKTYTVHARALWPGVWGNTVNATYQTSTSPNNQTVGPETVQVTVLPTCASFNSDGSPFNCSADTELNPAQANNTSPSQATCCQKITSPQLVITKTAADTAVVIGSVTSFIVNVSNVGDGRATDVTMRDTLPDGFEFSSPLPTGCSNINRVLTCGPINLSEGGEMIYTIPVTAVEVGDWTNRARVLQGGNITAGPANASVAVFCTCQNYYSDGSRFRCSPGSKFDDQSVNYTEPDQQTCCIDCKTCLDFPDVCGEFDDGCDTTIYCTCPTEKPFCHYTSQLRRDSRPGFCTDDPFDPSDNVDVSIGMDGPNEPVLANTEFDFVLTVRVEDGRNGARNVVVTDRLPDGLQLVSITTGPAGLVCQVDRQVITCRIGNMALAESRFITLKVKSVVAGTYTNEATVSATADTNSANNRATKTVKVVCKTCAVNFPALCGVFDDDCGDSITCTCPTDKPLCNRNPRLGRDAPGFCTDELVDPTNRVDVSISKAGPGDAVLVGEELHFVLTAQVVQGLRGAEDVVVRDELPSGLELVAVIPDDNCIIRYPVVLCNIGRMEFAETRYITIRTKGSRAGSFVNTANITAKDDRNPDNNRASTSVVVRQADPGGVDVAIRKTVNTGTVLMSNEVIYTLTAVNVGNRGAQDVVVTDTLPLGFIYVTPVPAGCRASGQELGCGPSSLAVGQTESYSVKARAVAAGTWDNAAIITADNDINSLNNGPVVAPVTVTRTCSVYSSDGSRFGCSPGSRYNPGQDDNSNPDQQACCVDCKTCFDYPLQCGTFDNDCGATIECTCPPEKPFCILSRQLELASSPGFCNNQSVVPTDDLDVSLIKSGPNAPQVVGEEFDFVIAVRVEQGDQGANSVVMTDTLPPGLDLVSAVTDSDMGVSRRPCDVSGRTITCNLGAMGLFETRLITVRVKGNKAGTFTNTARVVARGDQNDSKGSNDHMVQVVCKTCANSFQGFCGTVDDGCGGEATCTCPVDKPICHQGVLLIRAGLPGFCSDQPVEPSSNVDVSITKSGPKTAHVVGQEFVFVLTVRVEDGLDGAKNVVVKDTLPAILELEAVEPGDSCSVAYPVITCIFPSLLYTETRLIDITVKGNRPGRFVNRANVTADDDTDTTNNRDSATATVVAGSCCNPGGTCSQIPPAQCQGQYQPGLPCELTACGAQPTTGACCSRRGRCHDDLLATTCADQDGKFFPGGTCSPGLCPAPPSPSPSPSPSLPTPTIGACCSRRGRCRDDLLATTCADQGGRFFPGGTCAPGLCPAPPSPTPLPSPSTPTPTMGACCSKRGRCRDDLLATTCADQGGQFFPGRTCAPGLCPAPPSPSPSPSPILPGKVGACCIASRKICLEDITRPACQQQGGTWREGGRCIATFCRAAAAACCLSQSCSDVTSQQCAAQSGRFNPGSSCSSNICGPGNCTPSWLPCIPCTTPGCTDSCCPSSSCEPTQIGGTNYYTCKPEDVCRKEGEPCGNCKGGGVCCSGLMCRWSSHEFNGRCTKPQQCNQVGQSCAVDTDCCPGGRCGANKLCRKCTCSKKCVGLLGSRTNKCSLEQQLDCGALSAAVASNAE